MASWITYKCKECGYTIQTEPQGFYGLMSGMYYNFKCSNCKRIVDITPKELVEMGYLPKCPYCNKTDCLSTWNPVEGKCPECDGEMEADMSCGVCMAD